MSDKACQRGTFVYGRTTYVIEAGPGDKIPYYLKGPRGGSTALMRNVRNPKLMLPWNVNRSSMNTPFRDRWFEEVEPGCIRVY